jgi:hypothetical protein
MWKSPESVMQINLDTSAHAHPVRLLPCGSIGTASKCIVLIGQKRIK